MRCTCGKEGSIITKRRDFPYCQDCFTQHIIRTARKDAGEGPIHLQLSTCGTEMPQLQATGAVWEAAILAVCKATGREVIADSNGFRIGCAEIAAAEALRTMFGEQSDDRRVFPHSLTLEELQLFYSPLAEITLDQLASEVRTLEDRYPGTITSVLRSAADRNPHL